ncbi:response regulator transcription factor [Dyadobacter aurulentus]|uniref:response regulator transcription factor n=1 Tax=Dyadobacter sp. UC 10 TaxID=2605428 RepID=UPI0011F36BCD|nr:response regulator transcription factor [Dyadobacter sp. UC 10]KAA0993503.1 response regulator transcription factor [Dyadobacter sp. UC 10]
MIRILIADDHPLMRAGTRQALNNFIAEVDITEVDSFKKAVHAADSVDFDLAILDISMPGGNSVKMVETFNKKKPGLPVLILSYYDEKLYALAFIKAGARGYITKDAPESEFKKAVEGILYHQRVYLSEELREESFRMFMRTGKGRTEFSGELSVREREIAQMFVSGMFVAEIAAVLNLHTSTVSTHRMRILRKMGVTNVIDLAKKFNMLNENE